MRKRTIGKWVIAGGMVVLLGLSVISGFACDVGNGLAARTLSFGSGASTYDGLFALA